MIRISTLSRSIYQRTKNNHFLLRKLSKPYSSQSNNSKIPHEAKNLIESIRYQLSIKPEVDTLQKIQDYFYANSWSVRDDQSIVQLSKKINQFDIRILFPVKSPIPPIQQLQDKERLNRFDRMGVQPHMQTDIFIFITKSHKVWLCVHMLIVNREMDIVSLNFIKNYEQQKAKRKIFNISTTEYGGPQLDTIDQQIIKNVSELLVNLGIDKTMLNVCMDYGYEVQQKFYREWLHNFEKALL